MIYRVVLDDTMDLHTSDINCMLLNPSLDLEMNSAGSFSFTLPPSHPYWDAIKVLKSTIDVYEDGDLIFTGRIASIEKNWNNERVVQCEGALAYFNDSVHRQMKWETPLPIASEDPTVHNFLKDILDNHNVFEGAENANRHIFIGNITVDPEVVTREVNYDTTLDILTRMCIDTNGGYMSIRKDLEDGKLYLDWIKDFTEESGQPAQFGLNLLNFDTSLAAEDICTGVLARGAEVNEQTVMLNDVELVDETTYPDMSVTHYTTQYQDILWHREGVAKFGQVVQVHDFSDAQTAWKDGQGQIVANSLFEMAKKWLEEKNTKIETIEVEVAELAWLGEGMPKYKLGQIVELSDNVHMADESYETRLLPMYKLSCDLNSGSKKVTLGTPPKKELTQISASNSDSSTLSSSGSSSGGGGSGEGEECRVHDVKVNGTSVVTDKIANVTVPTDTVTQSQMTQAISTAIAPKANTADVIQALALKQDNLVFNSQDAATAHLTKIKNGNDVYDIPTGTEVEANPTGAATSDLTKLKVGSDIYGIPVGTSVVANPSGTPTDDLNTIKIGDTVYDIPGGGSTTNYGKFKCDVLFVNDPLPHPTQSGTANVTRNYTLSKSIDDYDAVYVIVYGYYYDNGSTVDGPNQKLSGMIFKSDYYLNNNWLFNSSALSRNQRLFLRFTDDTHVETITTRSDAYDERVLYKVYGLKFENKLINRSDIYSEEERLIGRWTDGKPLYQKTVTVSQNTNTNNSSWTNVPCGTIPSNIEAIRKFDIIFMSIYQEQIMLNENSLYRFRFNGTDIQVASINNGTLGSGTKITIQYTKTTDTADSGVLPEDPMFISDPMIYSEEEQVVGSWTDGKPLYQKSWDFGSNVNIPSGNYYTGFNIDSSNIDKILFGEIANNDGTLYDNASYDPTRNNHTLLGIKPDNTCNVRYLTLQYTKTTDSPLSGPKKGKIVQRSDIYSEEERLIGRWTDGKPLYQKSFKNMGVTLQQNTWTNTGIPFTGVDHWEVIFNKSTSNYDNQYPMFYRFYNGVFEAFCQWTMPLDELTIQYTKTTDLPFSKQLIEDPMFISDPMIYSEEEQVVGSWTDGKPLYQKTYITDNVVNGYQIDVSGLSIDKLIDKSGTFRRYRANNYLEQFDSIEWRTEASNLNDYGVTCKYAKSSNLIIFYVGGYSDSVITTYVTIRYTKTTDSILSGPKKGKIVQRSDIYSEEERLIGRWTDGKPLYQKTVYLQNVTINKDSYTSFTLSNYFSNVENAISYDVTDDLGRINPLINANSSYKVYDVGITVEPNSDKFTFSRGNSSNLTRSFYFTLRYTKTTDLPFSKQLIEDPQFVMMSDIYSEDEQVVGRWTDGKPLYQKTGSIIITANTSNWTLVDNLDNYDYLVSGYGTFYEINGTNRDYIPHYSGRTPEPRLCVRKDHKLYYYYNSYSGNNRTYVYDYTIQYTKTTDAPGTGPTKGNLIYLPALYSEEEREVGVWTDGKPIYQKSYCYDNTSSQTVYVDVSGLNIDRLVLSDLSTGMGTPQNQVAGNWYMSGNDYGNCYFNTVSNNIEIRRGTDWEKTANGVMTIQYTKTTDQPGSGTWTPEGQLAHHYSTSEKIVGTWIDGSTVYERTWDFGSSPVSIAYNSWTSLGVTISNFGKLVHQQMLGGTDGEIDISGAGIELKVNTDGTVYAEYNLDMNRRVLKILTLQYTKAS